MDGGSRHLEGSQAAHEARASAKGWHTATADQIARALDDGLIQEVDYDKGKEKF